MPKIKTIQHFYNENGESELRKILNDFISITEKIDAHRFSFERKKDSIYFYGKLSNKPLTLIDLALSDLYEPAIKHILSIDKERIQENIKYGCYFISPNFFLNTEYKKRPKNNLILTDLKMSNDIVLTPKKLRQFSIRFKIDYANSVAFGKLSDKVKNKLINFCKEDLNYEEFIKDTFPKFEPLLGKSIDENVEGFIIRSHYKKYSYLQITQEKEIQQIPKTNSNIFELLILDMLHHLKSLNFLEIKPAANNLEMRYLEFISGAFNDFINKKIITEDIEKPEFLKKSGQLSKRYFSDKTTLELIENDSYKYILRVFISTFNNTRKPRGIINEESAKEFNEMSKKIKQYISKEDVIDFMELKEYL